MARSSKASGRPSTRSRTSMSMKDAAGSASISAVPHSEAVTALLDRFDELAKELLEATDREREEAEAAAVAQAEREALEAELATTVDPATGERRRLGEVMVRASGLTKRFGDTVAVDGLDLVVRHGSIFGVVGPNGAGKTTTLSMITGLLRPDAGVVTVLDQDVWGGGADAKRLMGVLPDRLLLFDRLTGAQLLHYAGTLRGLPAEVVRRRTADLGIEFGMVDALGRLVSDYSAGMTKKVALAAAMIHSPRLLVLDEPFEAIDPVSAERIAAFLRRFSVAGGTVILSSHNMGLIERLCDSVAVIDHGRVLAEGTTAEVRGDGSLESRFAELAGRDAAVEGPEWLYSSSV